MTTTLQFKPAKYSPSNPSWSPSAFCASYSPMPLVIRPDQAAALAAVGLATLTGQSVWGQPTYSGTYVSTDLSGNLSYLGPGFALGGAPLVLTDAQYAAIAAIDAQLVAAIAAGLVVKTVTSP